ncbi:MAG: hypothetical protein U0W40_08970 [Acidimicrobiia bacterium]
MTTLVELASGAVDDLRRAGPALAARLLDDLRALTGDDDPGVPLVDDSGFRVFATAAGRRRFVYRRTGGLDSGRAVVWAIVVAGVRSDGAVYAETLERMQSADPPDVVAAARLLARLGRVTGTAVLPAARRREPVPDWLADRLGAAAGRTRSAVAASDAATAFDEWNRFLTEPEEALPEERRAT